MKRKYRVVSMSRNQRTIKALKGDCWHEIIERGDYGGATCKKCGHLKLFEETGHMWGWYCPDSPDHQCHYESDREVFEKNSKIVRGKYFVWSINSEKILLVGYTEEDKKYENYDSCIFCGEPEERK